MSLGFVSHEKKMTMQPNPSQRAPFQEPIPEVSTATIAWKHFDDADVTKTRKQRAMTRVKNAGIILLLICQAIFDLIGLAWVGLVLKWPITFGEKSHSHPHTPEEDYISRPNQYLNIAMVAIALDLAEPLWLLVMYCRNKRRKTSRVSYAYTCCTNFFLFYSFLCLLFVGALCSIAVPITISSQPAVAYDPPSPPIAPGALQPPSPPIIHETIFELGDLIVFYVIIFAIGVVKLISYCLGVPQTIMRRQNYRNIYA